MLLNELEDQGGVLTASGEDFFQSKKSKHKIARTKAVDQEEVWQCAGRPRARNHFNSIGNPGFLRGMGDIILLRHDPLHERPPDFVKRLVLGYPRLKPSQQLHIILPEGADEARRVAEAFSTTTPNVFTFTDTEKAQHSRNHDRRAFAPSGIIGNTQEMLVSYGIRSPFDTGLTFPTNIPISLDDFGLSEARLAELDKVACSWDFDAHEYSADELLGIAFCMFKRLLAHPGMPAEVILSDAQLLWFLAVCRAFYNTHVPYHSYWHSVDVAQLTFALIHMKPSAWDLDAATRLALVLAALGHDMKHPGLVVQVICSVDLNFSKRWKSLENYHLDIFKTVLEQLWPCIKRRWSGVVHEAIEATEMANHQIYLTASHEDSISFVHTLKISDFGSALRHSDTLYDTTACLIFTEFYDQALLCHNMGSEYGFPKQRIDVTKPVLDSFIALQLAFLHYVVLPYFEWVAERIPWFEPHLRTAEGHYQRFKSREEKGEMNDLYKYLFLTPP